ncbi:MAG: patatin [Gammaproteobacteria bacterium]|nr:MAG: patatin [Gammaproteobacteria bacterium]
MPPSINSDLGLAMTGGGARAAYQVGVLRYICKKHSEFRPPIITGVSAGAVNAAHLAAYQGTFSEAVEQLAELWQELTTDKVFHTDSGFFFSNFFRWGLSFVLGGSRMGPRKRSLLDSDPLRQFLEKKLASKATDRIQGIQENIDKGHLQVLGISSTNYGTGKAITWVQGHVEEHWQRPRRRSESAEITVEHVMASTALPLVFPAIKLDDGWHGDGGIRSIAPLSPTMHLGAKKILAISTRYRGGEVTPDETMIDEFAPVAQIIGILLDSIFLDLLDYDAANMSRINMLYDEVNEKTREALNKVNLLILRPSEDLGKLASQYEIKLPQPFRYFTRGFGTRDTKSPDSLSLLMFQPDYLNRLIELGETDAEENAEQIEEFLTQ